MQAHVDARANRARASTAVPAGTRGGIGRVDDDEEHVVRAIKNSPDPASIIATLVSTLLAVEAWRENVLFVASSSATTMEDRDDGNGNDHNGNDGKEGDCNDDNNKRGNNVMIVTREGGDDEVVVTNDNNNRYNVRTAAATTTAATSNTNNNYLTNEGRYQQQGNNNNNSCSSSSNSNSTTTSLATHIVANDNNNTLRIAFILHVETTIISLLSCIFYSGIPPELLSSTSSSSFATGTATTEGQGQQQQHDVLLSLIDYCARQLVYLGIHETNSPVLYKQRHPDNTTACTTSNINIGSPQRRRRTSKYDEMLHVTYDATYKTWLASVSLARYICEHMNDLSPSCAHRILNVHDYPMLLIRLIVEPPWTRRRRRRIIVQRQRKRQTRRHDGVVVEDENVVNGSNNDTSPLKSTMEGGKEESGSTSSSTSSTGSTIWEKLNDDNEWTRIPQTDLLQLTRHESEPWLSIFYILSSRTFQNMYIMDDYRKGQWMKLRPYIHEMYCDQLPILVDVARYLDELSIMGSSSSNGGAGGGGGGGSNYEYGASSALSGRLGLLHQVDTLREAIISSSNVGRDGRVVGGGGRRKLLSDTSYWATIAQIQWDEIFSKVIDSTDVDLHQIAMEVYGGGEEMTDKGENSMEGSSSSSSSMMNDIISIFGKKETGPYIFDDEKAVSVPLSTRQISTVMIHILTNEDNNSETMPTTTTFELIPVLQRGGSGVNTTTITNTPSGMYKRIKLSVTQTTTPSMDGGGEAIYPYAKVVASVRFQNDDDDDDDDDDNDNPENEVIQLSIDSLTLPTVIRDDESSYSNVYDEVGIPTSTFPSKMEWRQLGDLKDGGIVIQLGFKRLDCGVIPSGSSVLRGYSLSQAFVSQPV